MLTLPGYHATIKTLRNAFHPPPEGDGFHAKLARIVIKEYTRYFIVFPVEINDGWGRKRNEIDLSYKQFQDYLKDGTIIWQK